MLREKSRCSLFISSLCSIDTVTIVAVFRCLLTLSIGSTRSDRRSVRSLLRVLGYAVWICLWIRGRHIFRVCKHGFENGSSWSFDREITAVQIRLDFYVANQMSDVKPRQCFRRSSIVKFMLRRIRVNSLKRSEISKHVCLKMSKIRRISFLSTCYVYFNRQRFILALPLNRLDKR